MADRERPYLFYDVAVSICTILTAAFGLIQWIWMTKLARKFQGEGQTETAKGVLIAAGISTLLSATCWCVIFR